MSISENYRALAEETDKATKILITIVLAIAAGTAGVGLEEILPYTGASHFALTAAMTIGVYCCLKLCWTWQFQVFLKLAADHPTGLTIVTHLMGVFTAVAVSLVLSYIALSSESAKLHDMRADLAIVIEQGSTAKRNHKAISSILSFIDTQIDKVADKKDAESKGLSGETGKGPIYRVWEATGRSLEQLKSLIELHDDRYEEIVQRLTMHETKMRRALDGEFEMGDRLAEYTKGSRAYADTYAELMELGLESQMALILNSFLDNAAPPRKNLSDEAKAALAIAKKQSRSIAGDIDSYIAERVVPLKSVRPYQLEGVAVITWRHLDKHWSQFLICAAFDMSLWFVLLMQLAALRKAREAQIIETSTLA